MGCYGAGSWQAWTSVELTFCIELAGGGWWNPQGRLQTFNQTRASRAGERRALSTARRKPLHQGRAP